MREGDAPETEMSRELADLAERLDSGGHRFPWGALDPGLMLEAVEACMTDGLNVEYSSVGYGVLGQVKVLDEAWNRVSFVCHLPREMDELHAALRLAGGPAWVRGRMSTPGKRRKR